MSDAISSKEWLTPSQRVSRAVGDIDVVLSRINPQHDVSRILKDVQQELLCVKAALESAVETKCKRCGDTGEVETGEIVQGQRETIRCDCPAGTGCKHILDAIDREEARLAQKTSSGDLARCKHAHAHTDRNGNPICSECGEEL